MNRFLHSLSLLFFLLIFSTVNSQSIANLNLSSITNEHQLSKVELEKNNSTENLKVISYDYHESNDHHNHNHSSEITLLDVISSDEGADFNCSGGFCMNKLHYHKKGLTITKQLFGYFMSISC